MCLQRHLQADWEVWAALIHFSFTKGLLNICCVHSFAEHWGRGVRGMGEEGTLEGMLRGRGPPREGMALSPDKYVTCCEGWLW